jgi:hypothetical protein
VDKVALAAPRATVPVSVGGCGGCNVSYGLGIDGVHAFFGVTAATTSSIVVTTTAGAVVGTLSSHTSIDSPASIATDDSNVYWVAGPPSPVSPGNPVWAHDKKNLDGSPPVALMTVADAVPTAVEADGARVYWADANGSVYAVLPDGGSPTTLVANRGNPTRLVVAGGALYWTDTQGQQIVRLSLGGAENAPCTLASTKGQPVALAVMGDDVYYAEASAGVSSISRVPIACATQVPVPTTVWTAPAPSAIVEVAADDAGVYWLDQADGGGTFNRLE